MVEVYDSHEQGERVKSWLRDNGSAIVMGLVLAFGGLFGFKQWQIWDQGKNQQASAEYETLVAFLEEDQLDAAVGNYEALKAQAPDSAYATLAAMSMAKARIESGQPDLAIGLLKEAMNKARPEPVRIIARTRLARVYLDQGDAEAALETLQGASSENGFESRFAEIRGDIHRKQGNIDLALEEYNRALETQETGIGFRPLLEMKIQALESESGVDS